MRRTRFSDWNCSVARVADLLGDWWTPLILRDAVRGITRFDGFHQSLGIGRNTLTQRLERLVAEGMLERRPYALHPPRHDYLLTEKGRDFFPVIAAMMRWGDRWLADGEPSMRLRHTACGQVTTPTVVCSECGEPLDLGSVARVAAVSPEDDGDAPRPPAPR